MVRTMKKPKHFVTGNKHPQRGFSLLETLIAIVVLMIGLLAVLATFALSIGNTTSVQNDSIARQKAGEAIESIYSARADCGRARQPQRAADHRHRALPHSPRLVSDISGAVFDYFVPLRRDMGSERKVRGFSLVELLIAMALGLIVLGATMQLFKNGMDATRLVSQSSEMQQNTRAALNLIAKDVRRSEE